MTPRRGHTRTHSRILVWFWSLRRLPLTDMSSEEGNFTLHDGFHPMSKQFRFSILDPHRDTPDAYMRMGTGPRFLWRNSPLSNRRATGALCADMSICSSPEDLLVETRAALVAASPRRRVTSLYSRFGGGHSHGRFASPPLSPSYHLRFSLWLAAKVEERSSTVQA